MKTDFPMMSPFIHFLKGILVIDPDHRWTAAQASFHPFLTGEEFTGDWTPPDRQEGIRAITNFKLLNWLSSSFRKMCRKIEK